MVTNHDLDSCTCSLFLSNHFQRLVVVKVLIWSRGMDLAATNISEEISTKKAHLSGKQNVQPVA